MSKVRYQRLEGLVHRRLDLDRQVLDLFLKKKTVPAELQELIRAASNQKSETVANAIKLVGEQGAYGAVYVETKKFARNRYWNYFKSKSPEYIGWSQLI